MARISTAFLILASVSSYVGKTLAVLASFVERTPTCYMHGYLVGGVFVRKRTPVNSRWAYNLAKGLS